MGSDKGCLIIYKFKCKVLRSHKKYIAFSYTLYKFTLLKKKKKLSETKAVPGKPRMRGHHYFYHAAQDAILVVKPTFYYVQCLPMPQKLQKKSLFYSM